MTDDTPQGAQGDISRRIRDAWEGDDPAGWFEPLYAAAQRGEAQVPWAFMQANPQLTEWLDANNINGAGKTALVVGCGLGDDAQELARRGFDVTAFDISETAISWAEGRFVEDLPVNYVVADLFNTPEAWRGAFDFVLEIRTVQALPHTLAEQSIAQIASYVVPGGTLWVMCLAREPEEPRQGIPWPLSRAELAGFTRAGLREIWSRDEVIAERRRFCIEYHKS